MSLAGDRSPINVIKEGVLFQLIGISFREAYALRWVSLQQQLEKADSFVAKVGLHWDWLLYYVSQHLLAVSIIVRWSPAEHLVKKSAQTPPISSSRVANAFNDLWSEILRSTTKAVCFFMHPDILLGETEICDPYMPIGVKKYIFWL
jgi:hypothetical protein